MQPLYLSADLTRLRICRKSGRLADQSCETRDELFTAQQAVKLEEDTISAQYALQTDTDSEQPRIRKPSQSLNIAMDPRIPDDSEYFEFELAATGGVKKINWYVNHQLVGSTASKKILWQVERGNFVAHAVVWRVGEAKPLRTDSVPFRVH